MPTISIRYLLRWNKQRPDGLYSHGATLMSTNEKQIVGLCLKEPNTVGVHHQSSM